MKAHDKNKEKRKKPRNKSPFISVLAIAILSPPRQHLKFRHSKSDVLKKGTVH
jgi:hypothetical protein